MMNELIMDVANIFTKIATVFVSACLVVDIVYFMALYIKKRRK